MVTLSWVIAFGHNRCGYVVFVGLGDTGRYPVSWVQNKKVI